MNKNTIAADQILSQKLLGNRFIFWRACRVDEYGNATLTRVYPGGGEGSKATFRSAGYLAKHTRLADISDVQ